MAAIGLKGYLIPGTPAVTKRYLPDTMLEWFGKNPEPNVRNGLRPTDGDDRSEADLTTALTRAGVLEPCETDDDLCLAPAVEEVWRKYLSSIDTATCVEVSRITGEKDADYRLADHGDGVIVKHDDDVVGVWPSKAALAADVSCAQMLSEVYPRWDRANLDERASLLRGLRLFVPVCPTNGGPVEMDEERVESCCGAQQVVTITCSDTGDRLFERPLPE